MAKSAYRRVSNPLGSLAYLATLLVGVLASFSFANAFELPARAACWFIGLFTDVNLAPMHIAIIQYQQFIVGGLALVTILVWYVSRPRIGSEG